MPQKRRWRSLTSVQRRLERSSTQDALILGLDDGEEELDISGDERDTSPGDDTGPSPAGASSVMGENMSLQIRDPPKTARGVLPRKLAMICWEREFLVTGEADRFDAPAVSTAC
ncbi:unnamed protein product [Sphacelaria rigidula]